jgi:hypothetical protein
MDNMNAQQFQEFAHIHINTTNQIFGVALLFNEQSIFQLDGIISKGWPESPPQQLDHVVLLFGSFLGEAIIAALGGAWAQTDKGWGIKIGQVNIMVFTKMRKRFQNGIEDSITHYYQTIKKSLLT